MILGVSGTFDENDALNLSMIIMFFLLAIIGICGMIDSMMDVKVTHSTKIKEPTEFYNGYGNLIPNHIIQLEVKSHFYKLKQSEKDSINKYFYFDSLK